MVLDMNIMQLQFTPGYECCRL